MSHSIKCRYTNGGSKGCLNQTKNPTGLCHQHSRVALPENDSISKLPIPRVGDAKAPTQEKLPDGEFVAWDSLLPKPSTNGMFSGIRGAIEKRRLRKELLAPIDLVHSRMNPYSQNLREIDSLDKLTKMKEMADLVMTEGRLAYSADANGVMALATMSEEEFNDVYANRDYLEPSAEGLILKITKTRRKLISDHDVTPDSNGNVPSIFAHIKTERAFSDLGNDAFDGYYKTYYETPEVVELVQRRPEDVDRIIDLLQGYRPQLTPDYDIPVRNADETLPIIDVSRIEEGIPIHSVLDDGAL